MRNPIKGSLKPRITTILQEWWAELYHSAYLITKDMRPVFKYTINSCMTSDPVACFLPASMYNGFKQPYILEWSIYTLPGAHWNPHMFIICIILLPPLLVLTRQYLILSIRINCKFNNFLQLAKKLAQTSLYINYIRLRKTNKLKFYKDFWK